MSCRITALDPGNLVDGEYEVEREAPDTETGSEVVTCRNLAEALRLAGQAALEDLEREHVERMRSSRHERRRAHGTR